MFIDLSYSLDPEKIILPGSIDLPKVILRSRMIPKPENSNETNVRWDTYSNTSYVQYFAHTGTHIDTPYHVDSEGFRLQDFSLDDFIFESPVLLDLPKGEFEKITVEELKTHEDDLAQADVLLMYTGWSEIRAQDPDRFVSDQPSFTKEAANYLVDNFNIRTFGIDTIGIENIAEGRSASPVQFPIHKTFLLKDKKKTFVIEDLNLKPVLGKNILRFFAIPLRLFDVEAMSITAFAEVGD